MNRKALLIAVVAAAAGVVLILMYQDRIKREAVGGHQVAVLVAVQDIALGEKLVPTKLGLRSIPEGYLDDRHIRQADLQRVLNVRVSVQLRANQAVLWSDLATGADARRDLSSLVDRGMRGVTVQTDARSTFGGLVRPGDRVDVLVTMERTDHANERVTVRLLENVLVLAAGRDTGGEVAQARGAAQAQADTSHVTVLASLNDAQRLVYAQDRGRVSLVLRHPEDIAHVPDVPETGMGDILPSARVRPRVGPAAAAPAPGPTNITPEELAPSPEPPSDPRRDRRR